VSESLISTVKRRLPGVAARNLTDEKILFLKGRIIYASHRIQWCETESKFHRLVALLGATFIYFCKNCQCTVFEQEVTLRGSRDCPFCGGPIDYCRPGDKVRLHYRYDPKALTEGNWWGERWDW
jgi:hypothetical protein